MGRCKLILSTIADSKDLDTAIIDIYLGCRGGHLEGDLVGTFLGESLMVHDLSVGEQEGFTTDLGLFILGFHSDIKCSVRCLFKLKDYVAEALAEVLIQGVDIIEIVDVYGQELGWVCRVFNELTFTTDISLAWVISLLEITVKFGGSLKEVVLLDNVLLNRQEWCFHALVRQEILLRVAE